MLLLLILFPQNGVLELDFAISRTGEVDPTHAVRYKEFGDWIRSCYGTSVASVSNVTGNEVMVKVSGDVEVDRVMIREELAKGQRIRAFSVSYQTAKDTSWQTFGSAHSVGNKRIMLGKSVQATAFKLTVEETVDTPQIMTFAVLKPCASG